MIRLKPKECGGGYEIDNDETAPVPPSLVKTVKVTGNYGLADEARIQFHELALKEGEVPVPVLSRQGRRHPILKKGKTQEIVLRCGRGRGKKLHVPPMEPAVKQVDTSEVALKGAFGQDDSAEGITAQEQKGKYPPVKLPPRYFEETDQASYEKIAGLFLQGLQDVHVADLDIFEDFEGDCLAPPQELTLAFEKIVEETEDQQVATASINIDEREVDVTASTEVEGPIEGTVESITGVEGSITEAEGSVFTDSELDSASAYAVACMSTPTRVTSNTFQPSRKPKSKPGKANGYCLFLRHKAFQTGTKGCISELMLIFDRDWKNLPDQEKTEWKVRAKTDDAWTPIFSGSSDRGRFSRTSSRMSSASSSTFPPRSLRSSTNKTLETRSGISKTSTTTETTISYQENVDDSDWF